MAYRDKVLNFVNDRSGNVAVLTAFVLPVLLVGIGAAVSYSDGLSSRTKLQNHTDIMSLAMAKITNQDTKDDAEIYFEEYISTHLSEQADCTYTLEENPSKAIVNCSGEIPSFMGGIMSKKTLPYSVVSKAVISAENIFEVAFVFDVSDSMIGEELEELKSGLSTVADSALFENDKSRISFLPFANTVRLGPEFGGFVTPGSGFEASGGEYNGCFDRVATDANVDLSSNPTFPLVTTALPNGRRVCPKEEMTAVFHKKATDWDVVDMTNNLETSFGTGMSDGLVWAFRSLDPSLRGVMSSDFNYPLDSAQEVKKHVIMMTDGRPYDRPWTGPGGGAVTRALSLARFNETCETLPFDTKDISFHLINYNNNTLSQEAIGIFESCVSGEGRFYNVSKGGLEEVLTKITERVSGLRLTH